MPEEAAHVPEVLALTTVGHAGQKISDSCASIPRWS